MPKIRCAEMSSFTAIAVMKTKDAPSTTNQTKCMAVKLRCRSAFSCFLCCLVYLALPKHSLETVSSRMNAQHCD